MSRGAGEKVGGGRGWPPCLPYSEGKGRLAADKPQYHLPELPQYHLLELRGRRGRRRRTQTEGERLKAKEGCEGGQVRRCAEVGAGPRACPIRRSEVRGLSGKIRRLEIKKIRKIEDGKRQRSEARDRKGRR